MTDDSLVVTLLRAGLSLLVVLGLLVGLLRVLARRGGGMSRRAGPLVDVEVLGRRQLSRTTSVQVVRVGGRVLVLGVSESDVRVLTRLAPADVVGEDMDDAGGMSDGTTPGTAGALAAAARQQGASGRLLAGVFDSALERRRGRHRG